MHNALIFVTVMTSSLAFAQCPNISGKYKIPQEIQEDNYRQTVIEISQSSCDEVSSTWTVTNLLNTSAKPYVTTWTKQTNSSKMHWQNDVLVDEGEVFVTEDGNSTSTLCQLVETSWKSDLGLRIQSKKVCPDGTIYAGADVLYPNAK